MKGKKISKLLSIVLGFAVCFGVIATAKTVEEPISASAAAGDVYTQTFSNTDEVNADFEAYYQLALATASSRSYVGGVSDTDSNFYVNNNELHRRIIDGDVSENYGTESFAVLTLTKKTYVNFELTVEYRMGDGTYYWPSVAFRQRNRGVSFLDDGAGVFVQKEGMITLWGAEPVGGPFESPQNGSYDRSLWHTLRIHVEGLDVNVYLDGETTPSLTRLLPTSLFRDGYISLVSVNNDSAFRNLKIKELAVSAINTETEKQDPVTEADTPDSLGNLAERVDDIDELDGLVQEMPEEYEPPVDNGNDDNNDSSTGENTDNDEDSNEQTSGGCGSSFGITGVLLSGTMLACAFVMRKKNNS